jgi:UDP-glucose 4-epimerase
MGVAAHVVHLPARTEVQHAHAAHDKIRRVSGRRDDTPLHEGLARMAAWVRQHGARTAGRFEGIEITRNLPPAWQA